MYWKLTYHHGFMDMVDPIIRQILPEMKATFNGAGTDFNKREFYFVSELSHSQLVGIILNHVDVDFHLERDPYGA